MKNLHIDLHQQLTQKYEDFLKKMISSIDKALAMFQSNL